MDFNTVEIRNYKRAWRITLISNCLAVVISWLLVMRGYIVLAMVDLGAHFTDVIIGLFIVSSFVQASYSKKQHKRLDSYETFDEKLSEYEKIYKTRLRWHVIACLVICFLYLLTGRTWFLYWSLIELFITMISFPNKMVFRKLLKNDEIEFV